MTIYDVRVPNHLTTADSAANWICAKLPHAGATGLTWADRIFYHLPDTLDGENRPGAHVEVQTLPNDSTGERLLFMPSGEHLGVEVVKCWLIEPVPLTGNTGARRAAVAVARAHKSAQLVQTSSSN